VSHQVGNEFFMPYVVVFRDRVAYDSAVATFGPADGPYVDMAPQVACDTFGFTLANTIGDPIYLYYNSVFFPGYVFFQDPAVTVNATQRSYLVDDARIRIDGHNWPDQTYSWRGLLMFQVGTGLSGGGATTFTTPTATLPARRWCDGFEMPGMLSSAGGENPNASSANERVHRHASRTPDGYGMNIRGADTGRTHTLTEYSGGGASAIRDSWERFYLRIIKRPGTNTANIARYISDNSSRSAMLCMDTDGRLALYNQTSGSASSLVGLMGQPLDVNRWYRIDVLMKFNASATGTCRVYVAGGLEISATAGGSAGAGVFHEETRMPHNTGGISSDALFEFEVDDWHNADIPSVLGVETLNSWDWQAGTHMQDTVPTGFGALHNSVAWNGNYRILIQNPGGDMVNELVSTTALSVIDAALGVDADDLNMSQLGMAAFMIGNATTLVGELGYNINGAGANYAAGTAVSGTLSSRLYTGPGTVLPTSLSSLSVLYRKANNAASTDVRMLQASIQYVGTWGEADGGVIASQINYAGHNGPYSPRPFGIGAPLTEAAVYVKGGTYTGNGTGQDIDFEYPVHFIYIRNLTTGAIARWWSSLMAGKCTLSIDTYEGGIVEVFGTAEGAWGMRVAGSSHANISGNTYEYVAYGDPGARFMLNGSGIHNSTNAPFTQDLPISTWTPTGAFIWDEIITVSSATAGLYSKGPGNQSGSASLLASAEAANILTFGVGNVIFGSTLCSSSSSNRAQNGLSLWRVNDELTNGVALQVLSYTGNASNPRTIDLTPASGRYPMLVYVQPMNGSGFFRDPSHTGSNSCGPTGANSTTAITGGGVDTITVNSSLNANGIVYNVFVIVGSPNAWENGEFWPVQPISPEAWPGVGGDAGWGGGGLGLGICGDSHGQFAPWAR
jgi:hypothetical protein